MRAFLLFLLKLALYARRDSNPQPLGYDPNVVVFPAPFGPGSPKIAPRSVMKLKPSTVFSLPYDLLTSLRKTVGFKCLSYTTCLFYSDDYQGHVIELACVAGEGLNFRDYFITQVVGAVVAIFLD